VLAVPVDVDMVTGPPLRDQLRRCLAGHPRLFVLDLRGVEFFGTTGLGLLVEARNGAEPDTLLRVVADNPIVLRPIEIAGLDRVVTVVDSLERALLPE
jgi:anti-sigma B factor antagonist